MSRPNELRVRRKAWPKSASLLRHALDAFLASNKIDADTRIDIITAVGEALANSIDDRRGLLAEKALRKRWQHLERW